jgi:hypothetical protein
MGGRPPEGTFSSLTEGDLKAYHRWLPRWSLSIIVFAPCTPCPNLWSRATPGLRLLSFNEVHIVYGPRFFRIGLFFPPILHGFPLPRIIELLNQAQLVVAG